jgi:hypothetical protein
VVAEEISKDFRSNVQNVSQAASPLILYCNMFRAIHDDPTRLFINESGHLSIEYIAISLQLKLSY